MLLHSRPIRQLLLALVLIAQVPAVLTMGLLVASEYRRQRQSVTDDMAERARILTVALRERMEKVQTRLDELSLQVPMDADGLPAFFEAAQKLHTAVEVDAVVLVRRDGQQLVNTRVPWGTPLPHSPAASLTIFQTGNRASIDLSTGSTSGRQVVGVGVPVVRDSRIVYALNAGLDAERFRDLIASQHLPDQWIAAIVDARGRVVGRLPTHERFVGREVTPDLADRIRWAASGGPSVQSFESHTLDGIEVVTMMRRSPFNGWTVVVSVPRAVLEAPVRRAAVELAIIIGLILASSIAVALYISRKIVGCIGTLRDAAAALPLGGEIQLEQLCFAEAQQLGRTIQQASHDIEAAQAQIERVTHGFQRALMREVDTQQGRIARDLHDSVGSSLAGVSLLLGNARKTVTEPRVSRVLEKADEELLRATNHVREISRGMMPAGSEAGALLPAIEQFAHDLTHFKGVRCTVRARGDLSRIPPEVGTHLYRIVQEATNNAVRHGHATALRITLAASGGRYRMTVLDDGTGCDFAHIPASHPGMGLRSMQARSRAFDARIDLGAAPGRGARVRVTWCDRDTTFADSQIAAALAE